MRQIREMKFSREQSIQLLSWGIRFFLTATLTSSQTPGNYAPFALGCIAASGAGAEGISALIGAAVGALFFLNFSSALPFLAEAILIFTTSATFRGLWIAKQSWFLPLAASGMFLAVSGIYIGQSLEPAAGIGSCIAAAIIAGVSAWYFQKLLPSGQERLNPDGLLYLGISLLLALGDLQLLGLSIGRIFLCTLLLYTAYQQGILSGAIAGLGTGLLTDLCMGMGTGSMIFTAAYGLGGISAGNWNRNRIWTALAFLAAVFISLLPAGDQNLQALAIESGLGAAFFLLLPRKLFGGKRIQRITPESSHNTLERLKNQLTHTAEALRDLYDSMARNTPQSVEENPAIIFDRAAEKTCRSCALCDLCWQREYTGTFNALNDATPFLLERGRALPKDFPNYFTGRCIHITEFITAINSELSAFLLRQQYRRQLEETRRSARGQYAQLSELLTATAAGLGESQKASGAISNFRVGAALRPKSGEIVCGDTIRSFRTNSGTLCLLLADGMGSGESARKESALTCRLLQQFLEADIEPEAALKTLNEAMALRGAETGSFTTIDLLTCCPESGDLIFYKFGAAPSYLKKGGVVRRVTGGTLPAGLRGGAARPDITRATLLPGSFAVIVSDGVADSRQDEWLQDLLAGWEGDDPQVLADLILKESILREGLQDDCGIQILYRSETGSARQV